jgi:transglutaminase-like putative cysteine protease
MDFSAWFEAYLGGQWHTFDARHNRRRIGRVLIGRERRSYHRGVRATSSREFQGYHRRDSD